MATYILSNCNRLYAGLEASYGAVPAITARNRFPAVKLSARQVMQRAERRDKTGSRTFPGVPAGTRRQTSFELKTYMTGWTDQSTEPGYGPLFQAALGGQPARFNGGTAAAGSTVSELRFTGTHGLTPGQAVSYAGEIRFVSAVVDPTVVQLNAPLLNPPPAGAPLGGTMAYFPATELQSISVFDYWTPNSAAQRVLCGTAVDKMSMRINGDFHEFDFSGFSQDLVDSSSFVEGMGQLMAFPREPVLDAFDYSIIPGHLGQAWLGNAPDRFFTITSGALTVDNDLDARANEFGSSVPRAISPGRRTVSIDFDLYERDDAATMSLYQAAKQQSPIAVMFQLGQQNGQLFGIYLKSVVPEVPEFDDGDNRLQWRFRNSRAQGTVDDEIVVAFG